MHVLIIPSEQFVPPHEPLAGIFQYHQAQVIKANGHRVGVLSIRLAFTIPMIFKGLLYKCMAKKTGNACDTHSFLGLLGLLKRKLFNPESFITEVMKEGIPVISAEGFYFKSTAEVDSLSGWIKAGIAAVDVYIGTHGKPDLIHAHNALNAGVLAESIKEKHGIPYLITEHSSRWARNEVTNKTLIARAGKAYRSSKANFAVSTDFCNKLNKKFNGISVKVLPNVIDPALESRMIEDAGNFKASQFTFLHIAELKPIKDQATIIKAFKIVSERIDHAVLYIGGSGELSSELHALVEQLRLENKVKFLGHLEREDVFKYINTCDCFVMCSLYETFCVVLIEALLFGKPVVSGNSGGPNDIVDQQVGVLVETKDPSRLAEGMLQVYDKIDKYDRNAIRSNVIRKFGTAQFINEINKIYKEVVNEQ